MYKTRYVLEAIKQTSTNPPQSVLWRSGIWSMPTEEIIHAFAQASDPKLMSLYNIDPSRPSSCKLGALDFINDLKFVLPIETMLHQARTHTSQPPIYRCLIDENNPWQSSHGAHHAVDLVLLFGGFDDFVPEAAKRTGRNLREKWVAFVHGEEPWPAAECVAFGPHGMFVQLDHLAAESRRRMAQVRYLRETRRTVLNEIFVVLAINKLSLLN